MINHEELSFFNRQLAALLNSGIPLEGALSELARTMKRGGLRDEIRLLESDLSGGMPLEQAVSKRAFPEIYKTVLGVAARGRNLPGFLILLADYYHRAGELTRRLQGLMMYPLIVLICSFLLAAWISRSSIALSLASPDAPFSAIFGVPTLFDQLRVSKSASVSWAPPFIMLILILTVLCAITIPRLRRWLNWRLPAFREGQLTRFADALAMLLRSGIPLPDALGLMLKMEDDTVAGPVLQQWISRIASGCVRFHDIAEGSTVFPPLFVWIVAAEGDDLGNGFARAAEIYRERARYRSELLLQALLPATMLFLGIMVMAQVVPWMGALQNRIADLVSIFRISNILR